jgi:LPS O-antigen subunit length determinant protein (WzzB/FepE family)
MSIKNQTSKEEKLTSEIITKGIVDAFWKIIAWIILIFIGFSIIAILFS